MRILKKHEIRGTDDHGSGYFGAPRSHAGDHQGIDLICDKDDYIYAPFNGTITKIGYAYSGSTEWRYTEITGSKYRIRIFYMELDSAFKEGSYVPKGQFIGIAEDIAERYAGITTHLHVELYDSNTGRLLDPTPLMSGKKKVST